MIWVHNLYLMLVPAYMKRMDVNCNIGFFLHSPMANMDVFNTFQFCNEILKSLLCSDVIGFHLFDDAKEFCRVCNYLFKLEYKTRASGIIAVEYNGRNVFLKINHIGINEVDIAQFIASP
jgi:trehalose 6-phosphate synthase/phosphatase